MIMEATDGSGKATKAPIHPDVYSITHDLRAPLMSIKGLICLIKSDIAKEHLDEYITFLEASVAKMDKSILEIIDSSKESHSSMIQKQEIDFKKIIAESLRSLQYMEDREHVHVTVSVQEPGLFLSDYDRLLSIINNMISNAVRYRDHAKNSFLHIDVSCHKGLANITFEDNGIGIDKAFQPQIFDKLFRVSDDHRGSGLGLHIVQKSVERLNGNIKLHSVLGEGTTFTIEIPNQLSSHLSIHCD